MDIVLLAAFPVPLSLLLGLGVLLVVVLILYWFFMAKNNPGSRKVDELPPQNEEHRLQDRFDRGDISEEEYRRKLAELESRTKHP